MTRILLKTASPVSQRSPSTCALAPEPVSNHPLRDLSPDEALTPLAFSAQGFPGGQWQEVEVTATGELGWVSAGSAFISCNINPASFPPAANIPPTPTSASTNTPQAVAQAGPPRITNNPPGGYHATILVYPEEPAFEGEVWNWDFDFWINTN